MGRSASDLRFFLSTTLPHPDDPDSTATYQYNPSDNFRALAAHLTG